MGAGNVQFICGVRWFEWAESFSLNTTSGPIVTDDWSSRTVNNLYGGQIGIDALLYSNNWLHVESVLKVVPTGMMHYQDKFIRQMELAWRYLHTTPSPAAFVGESFYRRSPTTIES